MEKMYTFAEKIMPLDGVYSESFLNVAMAKGENEEMARNNLVKENEHLGYGTLWARLKWVEPDIG